ncbi:hypothetical protein NC652_004563 [Populus alba x Populus x berolinensis]|nr:hypothetical protein NC652_004563 [Populus alba x Populus x berolinensis]
MEKGSFSMTILFVLFVITTCVSMSNIPVVEGGEIKLNVPCNTTANCHQKNFLSRREDGSTLCS